MGQTQFCPFGRFLYFFKLWCVTLTDFAFTFMSGALSSVVVVMFALLLVDVPALSVG